MWFEDSLFENWIIPSAHVCDTQNGIVVTLFPGGANDYTCTELPDTFWGIIDYSVEVFLLSVKLRSFFLSV